MYTSSLSPSDWVVDENPGWVGGLLKHTHTNLTLHLGCGCILKSSGELKIILTSRFSF